MTNNKYNFREISFISMVIICLFIVYIIYDTLNPIPPSNYRLREACLKYQNSIYNGSVIRRSYEKHFYYHLTDSSFFRLYCLGDQHIEIGDSIYKPSGTFDVFVYKKANPDSVVLIECDFDCNEWGKELKNE